MRRRVLVVVVALFVLVGLLLVPALTPPANASGLQLRLRRAVAPGVRIMTFLDAVPRNVVNVVEIMPGSRTTIKVVPAGGRATASVAALCARVGGVACINGDMFNAAGPLGGEVVNGHWVKAVTRFRQQLWVTADGHLSSGATAPAGLRQSLGATTYNILNPGAPIAIPEHSTFANGRYARTLVGWDGSGDRFLVTVEKGRGSTGMSLAQAAALMRQLGATTAVNLDGGGSSAMVARGRGYLQAGRPVANVLAVVPA